jgi:hypothetical protein
MQPVTMTRVIGGKRYSTATATLLASDAYWQAISDRLGEVMPALDDYPMPAPAPVVGLGEALYDSEREYMGQIAVYKAFQGKEVGL